MSCGVALAVSLLLSDPNIALAAALPPPAADAPVSVAGEPLFADIVARSGALKGVVQGWIDAGVMDIVAVTDPMQLGFNRQAMVGIRCQGDTTKVAERLAKIDAVSYVVLTAGNFDALAEIVCADDAELLELLNTEIRAIPGVTSTETLVYLKLVKQQYNWGTR